MNEFLSDEGLVGSFSVPGARKKLCKIDRCIASIVRALEAAGINMRASCCGHGKGDGKIILQDGRELIIQSGF